MSFVVKEADVVRLVMGYLLGNGCYEALNALSLESNTSFEDLPSCLLYLQKLILQGRWSVVFTYIDEMKEEINISEVHDKLEYIVHHQKYLELLSWQGGGEQRMAFPPWRPALASDLTDNQVAGKDEGGQIEMATLVKELNTLRELCSAAEFNALCAYLTLDRLESHPDYRHWTVAQGRWTCFAEIAKLLSPFLTSPNHSISCHKNTLCDGGSAQGLLKTIAMSLKYQTAMALDKPFSDIIQEQTARFDYNSGLITPFNEPGVDAVPETSAPCLVLNSPVKFRQRFDGAPMRPQFDPSKIDSIQQNGTAQVKDQLHYVGVLNGPTSPPNADTKYHLSVSAPHQSPPEPAAPTQIQSMPRNDHVNYIPPQPQSPAAAYVMVPSNYAAPQSAYAQPALPGHPPQGYNVFGFAPAAAAVATTPEIFIPASAHRPSSSQRLSIEVGDGPSAEKQKASQQHQQLSQRSQPLSRAPVPSPQQQQVVASNPAEGFVAQNYVPVDPFTPLTQGTVLPGNYFQPQVPYYQPSQQQAVPPHNQFPLYPAPPAQVAAAYIAPNQVNVAIRSEAPLSAKAPVAWTAGDEQSNEPVTGRGYQRAPASAQRQPDPAPAAFTVPVLDENKVKQMPAALRRKMQADQEAAALAEEERQQESLQAERALSRGRARSAPRGSAAPPSASAAVPVSIVTPASNARPKSAVRTRGAGGATFEPTGPPSLRGGVTNDVRKSSETAISKFSNQSQPSQAGGGRSGGASRIPMAAPLSVQSGASTAKENTLSAGYQQRMDTAPILPAEKSEYVPHVLYESKCPLRCVSVLGGGPARTQFAVGTNAKSVLAMSYARGALDSNRSGDLRAGVALDREMNNIHNGSVYCMDYHAGLGLLATGSNDKAIRFSSPITGQFGEVLKEHTGTIRVVKFLAEQSSGAAGAALLASAGAGDCKPRLWDAQAGRFLRAMSEHPDAIHGLSWVNENLFVTGCDAGVIIGHDLRSARPAWSYSLSDALPPGAGGQKGVCCLALLGSPQSSANSPASVPMVAGGLGGFVTLFNAATGQIFSHEKLHSEDVRCVSVSPATSRVRGELSVDLLTGSYDGTAAMWRVSMDPSSSRVKYEGSPRVLTGHGDKVLSAVPFFAGGRSSPDVLTTGADGKVLLWTCP